MNKFKNFNKLIVFNIFQLIVASSFWIFYIISLISQPLIILILYFTQLQNIILYSLIIILVPLILLVIQILVMDNILFQDNKKNSIDYRLICSKYSKKNIIFSRIITILIALIPIIVIHNLFSLLFVFVNMSKLFLALFVSNTFISPLIYLIFISLFTLLTLKLNKISYLITSLILVIVTLGLSLFTRPILSSNYSWVYDYSDSKISAFNYSKLINKNKDDYVLSTLKFDDILPTDENLNISIDAINTITNSYNFIPSEWILSFYSSLFVDLNFKFNYNYSPFNLTLIKVKRLTDYKMSDLLNCYELRGIDNNFLKIDNLEYQQLILNLIDQITSKYNLFNSINSSIILNSLNNFEIWNEINKNSNFTLNFLKDATGVNTEFNQLFYLIKYPDLLRDKFPNLFEVLDVLYSEDISKIFKFIFTSENTQVNLFDDNINNSYLGILRTTKSISKFYPSFKEISTINPPNFNDVNFVKNELLKFTEINNEIYLSFLDENSDYSFSKDNLAKLNASFPSIRDYDTFSIYVDSLNTFKNLQSFLKNLYQIFPEIYKYNLNENYLNLTSSCVLKPEYSSKVSSPTLFILFYSLLPSFLFYLIRKQSSFILKRRAKND